MPESLRYMLLLGAAVYLLLIFFLLKTGRLSVRFSLVWLASGGVLVVFAACPYIVYVLREYLHMVMPVNVVFTLLFCFVLLVLLSLSVAVSDFAERIKRLAQANAILEKRVRQLEQQLAGAQPANAQPPAAQPAGPKSSAGPQPPQSE